MNQGKRQTDKPGADRSARVKNPAPNPKVKGYRGIALGWLKRGRLKQAILNLNKAIEADPTAVDAYLELGRVLLHLQRWRDLIEVCRSGLQYLIETSELHKMMITALENSGSWDDAAACYELRRLDERHLKIEPDEILCCVVVRDERPRLPWFLDYYRRLGVSRFFFVDNGSTDGTAEWLLQQRDVNLWSSGLAFKLANFGSSWFELLLRRFGVGHWCLAVDIDEFLIYEGAPHRSLKSFCSDLASRGKQVATGVLLDMYSDRPIIETVYRENDDPLSLCPFFDRSFYHTRSEQEGQYQNQTIFFGGVRQRKFPTEHSYLLSKAVLFRYQPDVVLTSGQHLTNIAEPLMAKEEICLLHFKFFSSVFDYARVEAKREMHAMAGEQYKAYNNRLQQSPDLTLFDSDESVRFESTEQLRRLGILEPEEAVPLPDFPLIPRVSACDAARPFWSVMITVFERTRNVEHVLNSVLAQVQDDMQIEVVCDLADLAKQREIAAEVERVGKGAVRFTALPERAGHPGVFNHCIERATGHWIHILHDDDWLEPGFYSALRAGIESCPEAGAAFCQYRVFTREAREFDVWYGLVERETPGIIDDWLSRIALWCRVQFSAMTVRREAFEAVGGFCADARSAFDWEMWIRVAVRYPVYYLPEIKVNVGRDSSAESSKLQLSGKQILDAFTAVKVAASYLPPDRAGMLIEKARDHIAVGGLKLAIKYLDSGNYEAAVANLRAAVAGNPSERTLRRLTEALQGVSHEYEG